MKIKKIQGNNLYAYRRLRRAIGYLGILLPIVLVLLSFFHFFDTDIQPSISHYYFTNLREVFTGTLCAVALFLICYKGHGNRSIWKNDNLLTNIAGFMALGVALIPTSPLSESDSIFTLIPIDLIWLHYGFAAILFLIFSLLSINVFTLGQEPDRGTPVSIWDENNIYRFCGYSILVFIILIPFSLFAYSTLVFEALSLFMFGASWLIKGRALGDKGVIGEKLYREQNLHNTEDILEEALESQPEAALLNEKAVLEKFKFSIQHPPILSVGLFRIHYMDFKKNDLAPYRSETKDGILYTGEIELDTGMGYVDIEIRIGGRANLAFTYNVEYDGRKLLTEEESNVVVPGSALYHETLRKYL